MKLHTISYKSPDTYNNEVLINQKMYSSTKVETNKIQIPNFDKGDWSTDIFMWNYNFILVLLKFSSQNARFFSSILPFYAGVFFPL